MNTALNEALTRLEGLLGQKCIYLADNIGQDYCHDELAGGKAYTPDAVIEATTTEDVAATLKCCFDAGIPVTVRGAGTGKAGGSVAVKGGVVLSLKGMNKIFAFDDGKRTLTVQPGVLLQDVKAEAEAHGLNYPPDPGEQTATIGGNASTNASGPSALKYGETKDYILDATLVLADGSVVKLSDKPEYAAVLGSEGTLAVITELTLRLIARPKEDVILLLPFADSETCINAAIKLVERDPSALEYLDTDIVEFSGNVTGNPVFPVEMDGERIGATLMLQLEGESEDELDEVMEAVAEQSEELECLDILVVDTPTLKRDVWAAHDAFHTSMETAKCERELNIGIPAQHMAEFAAYVKRLGEEKGLNVMLYAHVGSGGMHIHATADMDKTAFETAVSDFSRETYAKCAQLGGDIVGEYGVGYVKTESFRVFAPESYAEFEARKSKFDPAGILNPGKVVG